MQELENNTQLYYPRPIDAVVLAGTDNNARRLIQGQNKAFLEIGDLPLVRGVVRSLLRAQSIDHVFVVGPAARLEAVLPGLGERVHVVQQQGKMLANAWAAIRASESRYEQINAERDDSRPLLIISCDLPLISAAAVDDFVSRAAQRDRTSKEPYAMITGVAEEQGLKAYYPTDQHAGIVRPYVHLEQFKVRLANIYVGRPRKLEHQEFLGTGFDYRKAERLKNVLILVWKFLGQSGGWKAAWFSLKLQLTLMNSRKGGRFYRWLRKANTQSRVEQTCSTVLGGKVAMLITPYAGLSLDADNEDDFRVLTERHEDWKKIDPVPVHQK